MARNIVSRRRRGSNHCFQEIMSTDSLYWRPVWRVSELCQELIGKGMPLAARSQRETAHVSALRPCDLPVVLPRVPQPDKSASSRSGVACRNDYPPKVVMCLGTARMPRERRQAPDCFRLSGPAANMTLLAMVWRSIKMALADWKHNAALWANLSFKSHRGSKSEPRSGSRTG